MNRFIYGINIRISKEFSLHGIFLALKPCNGIGCFGAGIGCVI